MDQRKRTEDGLVTATTFEIMNYGRAIKIVRTAHGLTQSALAERLSVGTSQLSLIEAGKRQPSLGVLQEIAQALGVPMHLLTLLASRPEDLADGADPKQVSELANALLRLLVRVGEQGTLPLATHDKKKASRKRSA